MLEMTPAEVLDIELELTTLCNAQCPLCYRNYTTFGEHYPEKNLSRNVDEVIKQIDEYPNLEDIRLVGSISEPTLYKPFFELVKHIKSRGIIIEICTNGDTRTPEWWKELSTLLSDEDRVYFTICGSTQELHEIYRKGTKLHKILKNAEAFRSEKKNDYAQCIRFLYNSNDFDSDQFKELVSPFSNVYMTETFLLKKHDNYIDKENLELLGPNPDKAEKYERIAKVADDKFHSGLSKEAYCKSWENKSQQIDISGNVYPCYLFLEASKGKEWDGDYKKVLSIQNECCKFCEKNVMKHCIEHELDFII